MQFEINMQHLGQTQENRRNICLRIYPARGNERNKRSRRPIAGPRNVYSLRRGIWRKPKWTIKLEIGC